MPILNRAPDLAELLVAAKPVGWATASGSIAAVRSEAHRLGWREVSSRTGDPPVDVLRPTTQADANPHSLSAIYGLGQQPLHTDGAHVEDEPPDVVVLAATEPNRTPTRLWCGRTGWFYANSLPEFANHGVFLVSSGTETFFATARANGRIRYDPGCMTPCDLRARQVVEFVHAANAQAVEHHWTEPGQLLLIDNRQTLHARAAVAEGDAERTIARVAFRLPVSR
jgi:hypothetical protein